MQSAVVEEGQILTMVPSSLIVLADFLRWVPTKLDYTNLNSWNSEVIRTLKMQYCVHYISMHGDTHHQFDELMYKRRQAPVSYPGTSEGMMVSSVDLNEFAR